MDRVRPGRAASRRARRIAVASGAAAVFAAAWAVSRLEPAVPALGADAVFTSTVERGDMLRLVRGVGTLVPETVVVIAASDAGRVERRLAEPGQSVVASTVLLRLASPQLEQQRLEAGARLREAQADLASLRAQLEDQRLAQESLAAEVDGQYRQATAQYEADLQLSREGLTDRVTLMKSRVAMEHLQERVRLERAREDARRPSVAAQVAAQRARIEQMEALLAFRAERVSRLRVRAGMSGVLQSMQAEVGQLVEPGQQLAKVYAPDRLMAQLRIPEGLADEVAVGQRAEVDLRSGVIRGEVSRIDPAAVDGAVLVDVRLVGALPRGARPDLSVDGTIELERLVGVLHVGRPVHAREDAVSMLFKLDADGEQASLAPVRLGKVSVNRVEVRSGLSAGDRVILSDMSAWDGYERVRLD